MQKAQKKVVKQKKKNIETNILMGQNTNTFSQLSAAFIKNKAETTEEQQQFLKSTPIIEYHDSNINRILGLLRKKADVTKGKAALELKQEVLKMNVQDVEQFIPIFAQLFMETILNQQAKQVLDEFTSILTHLLTHFKKTVLKEITTLYGPMLINAKISPNFKIYSLLFSGTEPQMDEKAFVLLMKPEVKKKFIIISKIILQTQQIHKIGQPHFQRNCAALMKIIRDIIRIKLKRGQEQKMQKNQVQIRQEQQWLEFISDIDELMTGKCIDEYLGIGGKAKAAILQTYSRLLELHSLYPNYKLQWKQYAIIIGQSFLDRDLQVQQSLWKNCNRNYILSLSRMSQRQEMKDKYALVNKYLPKIDQKFYQVLKLGGFQMYKSMKNYLEVFPETVFGQDDEHKETVSKITYIRKLFVTLLQLEDENQTRIQCYYELASHFIPILHGLTVSEEQTANNKRAKEINTLSQKAIKQIIENLQNKYYSSSPISKNSASYYIPEPFCRILVQNLQKYNINYELKFNPEHTFTLYNGLPNNHNMSHDLFHQIFKNCEGNEDLQLRYLLHFPTRKVQLDLTEQNPSIEKPAKIFLLSAQALESEWFETSWDQKKSLIVYDPRISEKDIKDYVVTEQQRIDLHYNLPKNLPSKLFDRPQFDDKRFQFFMRCLNDADYVHSIKFMLPFISDFLIERNPARVLNCLLQKFSESAQLMKKNQWVVSVHQVTRIRVITTILFETIKKKRIHKNQQVNKRLLQTFFDHFCEFGRRMYAYRMENEVDELLQAASNLLVVEQMQNQLFKSVHKSLAEGLNALKQVLSKEQKVRKVRVTKFIDFLGKALWYLVPANSTNDYVILLKEVLRQDSWKQASNKPDMWLISQAILNRMTRMAYQQISKVLVKEYECYSHPLGLIMCAQIILPLQIHSQAKANFVKLQQQIIKTISQRDPKDQLEIVWNSVQASLRVIDDAYSTSYGIKNILKQILKHYQTADKNLLDEYLRVCLMIPIQHIHKNAGNALKCAQILTVVQNLVTELPLNDINSTPKIYSSIEEKLLQDNDSQYIFLAYCGICTLFWQKAVGVELFNQMNKQKAYKLISKLFKTVKDCCKRGSEENNFAKSILFSVLTISLPYLGMPAFKSQQKQIHAIFEQGVKEGSLLHGITQGKRMKFASRFFHELGDGFIDYIIQEIPKECFKEFQNYKETIQQIQSQQQSEEDSSAPKNEHILNMFIEFSEIFMRMGTVLKPDRSPDQTVLLKLLNCPFAGLKKTIFILLRQMYDQKTVSREPPTVYKQLLSQNFDLSVEIISPLTTASLSSYFYAWQSIMLRRQAVERLDESEEGYSLSLQDYLSHQNIYENYLRTSFEIAENHLQYMKRQSEFEMQTQELLSNDLVSINIDENADSMEHKLFKLIIKSLFSFVLNFPLFLRDFIDRNRKYRNICQRLLRNIISDGIFNEEVKRVQLKQHEWKAQGNFEIFLNPKNRQMYAEYTHDVIRIGLRLSMKASYPLMPISIQFGDGLKIQEGGRWQLMLQTQLHNRNNTIINGILLWKENIDKKLAGVEECSICFDIVNAAGQLPKKGCKTCKKKFHGNCIMKWFSKSNKSECPLCKSQFL